MADPLPAATLLLDFARQRGVIDAAAEATLRARVAGGASVDDLAASLMRDHALAADLTATLRGEAEALATAPTIAGFRIQRRLGGGAQGTVWLAEQESVGRQVALKVVRAGRPEEAERFVREARHAGTIRDPHVVACHDAGTADGWLWLAMELVDGVDTASYAARKGGRLQERTALKILRDAAKGLEAIASAGLVHRDIKPANILIARDGTAKLADLGVARGRAAERSLTRTGEIAGTPAFMSPEQAVDAPDVDLRSDCWSLGATLFTLLVGEPPYAGGVVAVLGRIVSEPAPDPRHRLPGIGAGARAIIRAAMTRDRAHRYPHPTALREDIEAVLDGGGPRHAPVLLAASAAADARRDTPTADGLRAWAWVAAAGAAAFALALAIAARQAPTPEAVVAARRQPSRATWTAVAEALPGTRHADEAAAALRLIARIDATAVEPGAIDRPGLARLQDEVARLKQQHASLVAQRAAAPTPAPRAVGAQPPSATTAASMPVLGTGTGIPLVMPALGGSTSEMCFPPGSDRAFAWRQHGVQIGRVIARTWQPHAWVATEPPPQWIAVQPGPDGRLLALGPGRSLRWLDRDGQPLGPTQEPALGDGRYLPIHSGGSGLQRLFASAHAEAGLVIVQAPPAGDGPGRLAISSANTWTTTPLIRQVVAALTLAQGLILVAREDRQLSWSNHGTIWRTAPDLRFSGQPLLVSGGDGRALLIDPSTFSAWEIRPDRATCIRLSTQLRAGGSLTSLVVDRGDHRRWYGADGFGLVRTLDQGLTWTRCAKDFGEGGGLAVLGWSADAQADLVYSRGNAWQVLPGDSLDAVFTKPIR